MFKRALYIFIHLIPRMIPADVLVNLGLLPIEDIPQLPKTAWGVLSAITLILKHLQEALTSGADLWG
jgi:hypothetical protein